MPRPKKSPMRSDGRYEIKRVIGHKLDGTPIQKSFYSDKSKADAEIKYITYIKQQAIEKAVGKSIKQDITFEEWANKWLETFIKGKVKNNSYSSTYEIPVRLHLIPRFGKAHLCDITPLDVQQFLDDESKTHVKDTVIKYKRCLNRIFKSAIEHDLCQKNPVSEDIKVLRKNKGPEKRAYTKTQRDLIVEYAKGHKHGLAIMVMLFTGCSRSELLGLKHEDITDNHIIHFGRSITESKNPVTGKWELVNSDDLKTPYRTRDVPIPKWLYEEIQKKPRQIKLGGSVRNKTPVVLVDTEYIFHSAKGTTQYPRHFSKYVYEAFMEDMHDYYLDKGVDIPILEPHELRHTAATLWALDGIDVYTIAKLCGWSDLKMLSRVYGHSNPEALRKKLGYSDE